MLAIRLLGQFDLRLDGQPLALPSRPAQSLLAYLLLHRRAAHRRERLAGLLWPEAAEANARAYLRQSLWRIRRALAPAGHDYLLTDALTVQFDVSAPHTLDVAELEDGADTPLEALLAAADAYGGELLPGFYSDWAAAERERLQAVYDGKLVRLLDGLAAAQRWPEMLAWAERWLTHSPSAEPAFRGLMRAHAGLGNRAAVAEAYQRCVRALDAELGVNPSEPTRQAYAEALAAAETVLIPTPGPSAGASPGRDPRSAALRGAGNQRRVSGEEEGRSPRLHNLPAQPTPFVGREQELAEIATRLADPACRLLTLTGPGGIGKTRLALQAAGAWAGEAAFTDGVWFVPLAAIVSAEYLGGAMAEALSLALYGGQPAEAQLLSYLRGRRCLLVLDNFEHLLDGAAFLNTLLAEAPGVKLLVTSQERLSLRGEWLLEIGGMSVPPEPGTEAGVDAHDLSTYSAVRLFTQSAQRVDAGFGLHSSGDQAAVARICQLVGGLPLGLELAAAWLRALPVADIAEAIERETGFLAAGLRDLPPRHRSLQAVFDHSWHRLAPDEQAVYRRLAVLRGSFEREAAAQVAGAGLAQLAALVDKSLLHRSPTGRYAMHGLLRRYALAQLAQAGEMAAANDRHLAYCLALAEAAEPGLRRADQLDWLARLEAEHDNLRAALEWSAGEGNALTGLKLAGALSRFWYLRGHWQDGRHWLEKLLGMAALSAQPSLSEQAASATTRRKTMDGRFARQTVSPDDRPLRGSKDEGWQSARPDVQLARAKALAGLGWLANESSAGAAAYTESLAQYRAAGDTWGTAYALRGLGAQAWNQGEAVRANAWLAESLALFESLADAWGMGLVRHNQGWLAHDDDDLAQAGALWRAGLALFEQTGDRWGIALGLNNLGYLARLEQDDSAAAATSEAAVRLFQALGDKAGTATSLLRLGQVALRRANFDQARRLFEQSLALQRELERSWEAATALSELGLIAAIQGDPARAQRLFDEGLALEETDSRYSPLADLLYSRGQAAYYAADLDGAQAAWQESEQRYQGQADLVGAALARAGLGLVAWRRGEGARAQALLTAALAVCRAGADKRDLARVLLAAGQVTLAQGDATGASALLEEAERLFEQLGDRHGLAETFEALAALRAGWHAANGAAQLLRQARALRAAVGAPVPAVEAADEARLMAWLRDELGDVGLRAAMKAEGD